MFRFKAPALALALALVACEDSKPPQGLQLHAVNVLPPGESGLVTASGQAAGSASGTPSDYGPNLDDQRLLYWNFQYKDGSFDRKVTPAPSPKAGVDVFLDEYGVPSVYASNVADLWFGVGYMAAQQRLFLMDAVRRLGHGTAGALLGCTYVPGDIQTRTLTYTDAEYQQFFDRMQPDSKAAFQGYVDGANAWLTQLQADPSQMPAEYQLLSATPEPFTIADFLAAGVLITRRVAAEGGDEFFNLRMLRLLEQNYGTAEGKAMFLDLVWDDDPKAVTTVPPDQQFPNQDAPAGGRDAVFNARADWAVTLPDTVWLGPGTGGAAEPAPCTGGVEDGTTPQSIRARSPLQVANGRIQSLLDDIDRLHGGSWAVAIGHSRTANHGALLISSPQLGYSYPSELWEAEIDAAGYKARGVSVPGLPVIGIGYSPYVAWALTTGYSKTIDSFIETICSTAQIQANTCHANQYFHQGQWKDMECRTETIMYRSSQQGLPTGPANLSDSADVCRTVHGPIVARDDALGLARALYYSMWNREIDNVEGVREWNRAKNLDEFLAATAKVTWNENVTFATRDGDIGYVHPGRFADRVPEADQRFPVPGTGAFDFRGWLPFERMPHSINPGQGYLANWNTKPAAGWLDGEGISVNSRPGGHGQRVTSLLDTLASRSDWTFAGLTDLERAAGKRDPRSREYLPVFEQFYTFNYGALDNTERDAVALLLNWDRKHYGPDVTIADVNSTDTPAATIFSAWVDALRRDLFGDLEQYVLYSGTRDLDADGDPEAKPMEADGTATNVNIYNRSKAVGSHRFDQSVMDNLIVRIFDPASSGLAVRHDWLRGREAGDVLHATLTQALSNLAQQYGTNDPPRPQDLAQFRRVHPRSKICSLSKVIGPGSTTPSGSCVLMPYLDRGSWNHHAGWE